MTMRDDLLEAVGPGKPNRLEDVRTVQRLLDRQAARTGVLVRVSGQFDRSTQTAIEVFQRRVLHIPIPHAVVEPRSETLRQLKVTLAQRTLLGAAGQLRLPPRISTDHLSAEDYQQAATVLGCDARTVKTVSIKEAGAGAFDVFGRPTLRFERHIFHRQTAGKHDRFDPEVSNPTRHNYPAGNKQYELLTRAYALDASAAFRSASWGLFQIMGFNSSDCGFGSVQLFVTAMCQSEGQQLLAFIHLLNSNHDMKNALLKHDWATFARLYNGPKYKENKYDTELARIYESLK